MAITGTPARVLSRMRSQYSVRRVNTAARNTRLSGHSSQLTGFCRYQSGARRRVASGSPG